MRARIMDVEIDYLAIGTQGECVLLLHGWGCKKEYFEPFFTPLSANMRVFALDFPAHGASGRPPSPWEVADFGRLTAKFIETVIGERCHIVAHSFGGRVALWLGAKRPDLVKTLALTGCAGLKPRQTPEQQKRSAAFARKKEAFLRLSRLPLLQKPMEKALSALRDKYGSPDYKALDEETRKTFVKIVSEDLRPLLPDISAPTLLIFGESDTETPMWMGEEMEKSIPGAGLCRVPGGHFAFLEDAPRFLRILYAFWEGVSA